MDPLICNTKRPMKTNAPFHYQGKNEEVVYLVLVYRTTFQIRRSTMTLVFCLQHSSLPKTSQLAMELLVKK